MSFMSPKSEYAFPLTNGSIVALNDTLIISWRNNQTRKQTVSGPIEMDVVVKLKTPDKEKAINFKKDIGLRYIWNVGKLDLIYDLLKLNVEEFK